MNENGQNQNRPEVNDHIMVGLDHKPYWKRVHHSWIFWVFLFLTLASITIYIVSVNFAFVPQKTESSSIK